MPYRRRQQDAAQPFAWPPTREDLDLIEVVDANLRPIHAQCDEPEPAQPVQLDLLKSVTPVRPVRTLPPPLPPQQLPQLQQLQQFWPSSRALSTTKPSSPPMRMPMAAQLPFPRRKRIDTSLVIGTCGLAAIALSAYLSLRTSTEPVDVESALSATVDAAASIPRLPARPLSSSMPSNEWQPISIPRRQPPPVAPEPSRAHAKADSIAKSNLASAAPAPRPLAGSRGIATDTSRKPSPKPSNVSAPVAPLVTQASLTRSVAVPAKPSPAAGLAPSTPAPATVAAATDTAKPLLTAIGSGSGAGSGAGVVAPPEAVPPTPVQPRNVPVPESKIVLPAAAPANAGGAVAMAAASGPQMQQQIVAALHEYERGYERLDADAVRAVWPSVDARALARAFHDLKSQTLVFDRCDIDVARVQATAACRGRATYQTRVGEQTARTEPREWTFKLRKSDEAWQIVSASAR
jgi:hypothetical protein